MGRSKLESGERAFKVQEIGESLSITVRTPKVVDIKAGGFYISRIEAASQGLISWEDAGIVMNEVEAGTGYHVPEGAMAIYRGDGIGEDSRTVIAANRVKSLLMDISGLIANREMARASLQTA
jgi:hypothetical protein